MKGNVGKKDRLFRIILGIAILATHYIYYAVTGYYCVWANIGYLFLLTVTTSMFPGGGGGDSPRDAKHALAVILAMLALVAAGGCSHIRWSQRLEAWQLETAGADLGRENRPLQFSIAELIGAMVLVALIAGVASWMIQGRLFR